MFSDVLRAAEPRDSTDAGRSACGEQPHPNLPAKSRVRIPHRVGACVLPLRLRPLRLVARPVWAAADGSAMASHNHRIYRLDAVIKVSIPPCAIFHALPPTRAGGRRRSGPRASGGARAGAFDADSRLCKPVRARRDAASRPACGGRISPPPLEKCLKTLDSDHS